MVYHFSSQVDLSSDGEAERAQSELDRAIDTKNEAALARWARIYGAALVNFALSEKSCDECGKDAFVPLCFNCSNAGRL